MKKTYFSPETKVYNVLVNSTLLAGSGDPGTVEVDATDPIAGDPEGGCAKPRRNKNVDFGEGFESDFGDDTTDDMWK